MHRIQVKRHFRLPFPLLVVRNFFGLILGYKPEHITRRAWLFGNDFKKLETSRRMRWVCFDCYIRVLTPQEYEVFRSAYRDELALEDGREQADAVIARMDAVFADGRESA